MTITPILLTAVALCACKSEHKDAAVQPSPPVTATAEKSCKKPPPGDCPWFTCGGNSPVVNTFPINGMRPDGECNPEGVQLVKNSMTAGSKNASCKNATLGVRGNKLVGLNPNGTIACADDDLVDATFEFRSWADAGAGKKKSIRVKITATEQYKADTGAVRTGYRMDAGEGALCNPRAASKARDALGLDLIKGFSNDLAAPHDLVIPVVSELYNRLGHAIESGDWERPEREWLSLACVSDGLGKRSLYDLYTDDVENSRSALMMLIANYCGNLQVTTRGVFVAWQLFDPEAKDPHPVTIQQTATGTIAESVWGPAGAVCLSEPRLLYRDGSKPSVPTDLPPDLAHICPGCTPEAWTIKVRSCALLPGSSDNKEGKARPALPACDKCGDACKGRRFHSFAVPGPHPK